MTLLYLSVPTGYIAASRHLAGIDKHSGWGAAAGLAALADCNESSKTVHKVSMDCGVAETVSVYCCSHKECVFVLLCVTLAPP